MATRPGQSDAEIPRSDGAVGARPFGGRSVTATGLVHFLSRDDGSRLIRLTHRRLGHRGGPVRRGNTLVVVTRNGGVFGFRPE